MLVMFNSDVYVSQRSDSEHQQRKDQGFPTENCSNAPSGRWTHGTLGAVLHRRLNGSLAPEIGQGWGQGSLEGGHVMEWYNPILLKHYKTCTTRAYYSTKMY